MYHKKCRKIFSTLYNITKYLLLSHFHFNDFVNIGAQCHRMEYNYIIMILKFVLLPTSIAHHNHWIIQEGYFLFAIYCSSLNMFIRSFMLCYLCNLQNLSVWSLHLVTFCYRNILNQLLKYQWLNFYFCLVLAEIDNSVCFHNTLIVGCFSAKTNFSASVEQAPQVVKAQ